ncbi:MFS transporter [Streptomyces sp. ISL-66]|uniref:MFS transporter n=1 Tax=Streptomyces sp. ISL-66 TaxID=2819186 RepID=UPI002556EEA0|nr:MFS transporter [Streptomyces sp. ISL-66]
MTNTTATPPGQTPPPEGESLMSRLGLPQMKGQGNLVGAHAIDSVGSGLVLAFIVVYFAQTTTLSLPAIGAALTLARFLAFPTAILVGPLIDRFGARTVAAAGNLISAVGFGGFLLADQVWKIVIVALLTQAGQATYWTSSSGLVVLAAKDGERPRWFGFVRALRNMGLGLGGAIAAFAVGFGGTAGLDAVVIANTLSFVLGAALLLTWRPDAEAAAKAQAAASTTVDEPPAKVSYATVLRDRPYMTMVSLNLLCVFGAMLNSVLLAVYIIEGLHRGAWLAGTLLVLNTIQVAATQTIISRQLERFRQTRLIAAACGLNILAFGIFGALSESPSWLVVAGLYVAMFIYTLAEIVQAPPMDDLSVSLAPKHARGRYLAVFQLSWTVGQTLAPGLLTLLLSKGAVWPWVFLVCVSTIGIPLVLRLEKMMAARDAQAARAENEPVAATA